MKGSGENTEKRFIRVNIMRSHVRTGGVMRTLEGRRATGIFFVQMVVSLCYDKPRNESVMNHLKSVFRIYFRQESAKTWRLKKDLNGKMVM